MTLTDHLDYADKVECCIRTSQFDKLLEFKNFSLCNLMNTFLLAPILESNNKKIIKHVIDNLICANTIQDNNKWSLAHYLVKYLYNDTKLVRYIIEERNLELEHENLNRMRPKWVA